MIETQHGAFIQGRSEIGNLVVVLDDIYSIFSNYSRISNGADYLAIKIDIAKEYDQVSRDFL